MSNGMGVMVDASLQSDGSLLAARVQSMMGSGGVMGGGAMGGTITADEVALELQDLTGTASVSISSGSHSSFTLTLPSDCAFTTLTGATSVTGYQQSKTVMSGTSPIASGTAMHAYGLLFYDNGQWKMAAARIGAN